METKTSEPFPDKYSLMFAAVFLLMGTVETFVRPEPGSYFGPALLVFGVAMALYWWSGRSGNQALRSVANVIGGVGVAVAIFDIVADWF